MEKYLYIEIHEIFFCSFPIELYEWIFKLADSQGRWNLDGPIVWISEIIQKLEAFEDKIACIVDHLLNHVMGGFVTQFIVDTSVSYSEVEQHFFKGPRGKYVKYLNTWIKFYCAKNGLCS